MFNLNLQAVIVQTIVGTGGEAVVHAERPGTRLGFNTERGADRVGVNNADNVLDAAEVLRFSILVAEGRDNREINHRSNLPAVRVERARESNAERHLVDGHRFVFGAVLRVIKIDAGHADAGMRDDVECAGLHEVFRSDTEGDDVSVLGFLPGLRNAVHLQIILNLGVTQVSLDVEVAECLSRVEAHAVEIGIVFDLGRTNTDGVAVSLTDVEGETEHAAAGSGVVEAQNSTVDIGFIAGTFAVNTLGLVLRAEHVNPRRKACGARSVQIGERSTTIEGSSHLIVDIKRRAEYAAGDREFRSDVELIEVRIHGGSNVLQTFIARKSKFIMIGFDKNKIVKVRALDDGHEVPISTLWVHSDYPDIAFVDLGPDPVLPDPVDYVLEVEMAE